MICFKSILSLKSPCSFELSPSGTCILFVWLILLDEFSYLNQKLRGQVQLELALYYMTLGDSASYDAAYNELRPYVLS